MTRPEFNVEVPRRLVVDPPAQVGPSKFPATVDQLKLIEYSSVPAGGKLEQDLRDYYTIMSSVASNNASEQDLVALKELMLRVRNYVLTEDDFNLMADAIRTTQSYVLASIEAADGNYELVSTVTQQYVNQLNEWSEWLEQELAQVAVNKNLGAPIIYSETSPGPSAFGYLWVDLSLDDNYIAPMLDFNEDNSARGHNVNPG